MLVVGSGASGLAAAVSADRAGARVGLVAKDAVQSCNSAKAQGGIQAAFGDDDSPEQHAEDVWKSSHETADRRLVEVLTERGAGRDPLARRARRRVHARERRLPARPLRRLVPEAPAAGRRPHRPRDHEGAARVGRELRGPGLPEVSAHRPRAPRERLARGLRRARDRRGRSRPGRGRALLPDRRGARRADDEPSRRDGRGDADRGRPRRRDPRLRRAPVPPERWRVAAARCRATRFPRRRAHTARCC